jgi:hypothetical protein
MLSPWYQAQGATLVPQDVFIPTHNHPTQSQPQLYSMAPPTSNQIETRKFSSEDWDDQRAEITRLYKNNALESVRKFMRERHGLDAT